MNIKNIRQIPGAAWISLGMIAIGVGVGMQGIGSCAARQSEAMRRSEIRINELKEERFQLLVDQGLINADNLDKWFGGKSLLDRLLPEAKPQEETDE